MEMITEDYVSFETAKLLKEKGFDGPCYKVWESHGESPTLVGAPWFVEGETVVNRELVDTAAKQYAYEYNLNNKVEGYLAPTLQMAMKWLREKEQLYIMLDFERPSCIEYKIYKYESEIGRKDLLYYDYGDSYEQACEAAVKYCLEKLI